MFHNLFAQCTAITALTTIGCVVMHDANIDKAFTNHLGSVSLVSQSSDADMPERMTGPESHHHTHSESTSLGQATREANGIPRIQPRKENQHRTSQKRISKGFWNFDSYRLLLAMLIR